MNENIGCPLCGSEKHRPFFSIKNKSFTELTTVGPYRISESHLENPLAIIKCLNCGFVFSRKTHEQQKILSAYEGFSDQNYVQEEEGRRKAARYILKKIKKYKPRGKLLEIGSAYGFFLDEAQKLGWDAVGVELSKDAADYAISTFGVKVIRDRFEACTLLDAEYDVVVMVDVIEHLFSPVEMLLKIRAALKNDGILYISTPNVNSFFSRFLKEKWWGIDRFHLSYFSKKTLIDLFKRNDFQVVECIAHARYFSGKYIRQRLSTFRLLKWLSCLIPEKRFQSLPDIFPKPQI